jgi:formin 2
MPYATKLLADELQTYMNMGLRILTAKGLTKLEESQIALPMGAEIQAAIARPLPERVLPETRVPEFREAPAVAEPAEEDLYAMGVIKAPVEASGSASTEEAEEEEYPSYGYVPGQEGVTPPAVTPQGVTPPLPAGQGVTPPLPAGQGFTPLTSTPPYATNLTPPFASPQGITPPYATNTTPPFAGQPMPQQMPVQQGGFQQMYPAPLMYQQPYIMQPQMVYQAPMAQGPPTIVIDTSPRAMQQGGFLDELHEANSGVPVMGRRSMDRRHTTPRANPRGVSPQARPSQKGGMSFGGEPLSTGQKITVQKMG